jgi:hypothetical protein
VPVEPFPYRVKKWLLQQASQHRRRYDQHEQLNADDWDIVVVLDACRWDTLRDVAPWPIDASISPASATPGWLAAAEQTEVFEDTYIVSGNVQYNDVDLGESELHKIWETDWNARLGTVLPEPVLVKADSLLQRDTHPVVAHVLPPHGPYVAKIGDSWLPAFPNTDIWKRNPGEDHVEKLSPQVAMAQGHIDICRARLAYEASVESTYNEVIQYISRWIQQDHTVILTADHGETFGRFRECGFYGHPSRCHISPLVKVPYERFEQAPPPETEAETVEEKLAALGYVESGQ